MAKRQTILSQGSFAANSSTQQASAVSGSFGDASGLANLGSAFDSVVTTGMNVAIRDKQKRDAREQREEDRLAAEKRLEEKQRVRDIERAVEKSSYDAMNANSQTSIITHVDEFSDAFENGVLGLNGAPMIPPGGHEEAAKLGGEAAYDKAWSSQKIINEKAVKDGIVPMTEGVFRSQWTVSTRGIYARARVEGRRSQIVQNVDDRATADTSWISSSSKEEVTPELVRAKMASAQSIMGQDSYLKYRGAMSQQIYNKTLEVMSYPEFWDETELPDEASVIEYVETFGDLVSAEDRQNIKISVARLRKALIDGAVAGGAIL